MIIIAKYPQSIFPSAKRSRSQSGKYPEFSAYNANDVYVYLTPEHSPRFLLLQQGKIPSLKAMIAPEAKDECGDNRKTRSRHNLFRCTAFWYTLMRN
ncbi:hypothetical protein CDAR_237991 [Caerostris darwini]|uniref:Uncharacterized protein n=1 Tax=Caerostris darwini TaxID=1538125 RepID=A0AAV4S255_9ARAC|nr:hypothetical protein CDAR_237991 [Caerostris darwini]